MQNGTKQRNCSSDCNNSRNSTIHSEQEPLLVRPTTTKTFKRRHYILFLFSFYTWFCCVQWNCFGSIIDSMHAAFPDWNDGTVAIMENWVVIMYLITIIPIMWFVNRFGLRKALVGGCIFMAVALILRCISDTTPMFTIMCHISAAMIGIPATLVLAVPTMVTAEWFPQNERTTATAVIMSTSLLGNVGSYIEPLFIRQPSPDVPTSVIKDDILLYMYICAGIGCLLLIAVLLYFPSRPPLPPSITSASGRLEFKEGMCSLRRNKNFIIYAIAYGIAIGPNIGFTGVLNLSLSPLGYDQNQSMIIAQIGIITSALFTMVVGWLTDRIYGYLKETIIGLLFGASISYYWFLLIRSGILPIQNWQVCLSVTLALSLSHATLALFFELASELAFPVSESIVGGTLTASDSSFTVLFLLAYSFKSLGSDWVPYALVISNAVSGVILMFAKAGYGRTEIDRNGYNHIDTQENDSPTSLI